MGNSSRVPKKLDGRDLLANERDIITDSFESEQISKFFAERGESQEGNDNFQKLTKLLVSPIGSSLRSLLFPPTRSNLSRVLNIAGTLIRGSAVDRSSLLSEWIFLYSQYKHDVENILHCFVSDFIHTLFTWSRSAEHLLHIITPLGETADSYSLIRVWLFTREDGQSVTNYFLETAGIIDNMTPVSKDTYTEIMKTILESNPVFDRMLSIFSILFFLSSLPSSELLQILGQTQEHSHPLYDVTTPLLPSVMPKQTPFQSMIGPACMSVLTQYVPSLLRGPARQLFCSRRDGESFAKLTECVLKKGPTMLIVRDTDGFLFGGFASQSWELNPNFRGDGECFLFTVLPKLEIFNKPTFYNNHFMYYQVHAETLPNGLGMGGQLDYFGLWLSADFGKGHSRAKPKCTTYASKQLSKNEDFTVHSLEVWGFGQGMGVKNIHMKSALDKDPEAMALLELAGKTMHSEGIREPESDEEK
ncbi:TLD domain-containing protein 1 isoform X2 [Oopsacas minuta]|uniref:MTOR-associated protein MEAK7 n=1 Tax=Oopsacas minuta TaxID=111878 RepID=A0AAV7K018_9METZ|nr:TLD domain-containing protein 1 isoform X2 [Oopsacas minuta]